VPTLWLDGEGNTIAGDNREPCVDVKEPKNLGMCGNSMRENRETLPVPLTDGGGGRPEKAERPKSGMHADRESDDLIVPTKRVNKAGPPAAEPVEGRGSTKGNAQSTDTPRTQSRKRASLGLLGVRVAAEKDKKMRFTALLHHVTEELLQDSYRRLNPKAVPGVDNVRWQEYAVGLEERIADLHTRIHRGSYRALPSQRTWIPKADGRQRPLGIAALEDKIVQQAVRIVLEQIYEPDFLGFSYGFRPRRGCHNALDALWVGLTRRKVNWVLDADIRGFFDAINHEWLGKFIEHRVADPRILRLIRNWLKAGVMENGAWSETQVGTPQGAVISPFLANVFLHYVLDLWVQQWRTKTARGNVIIVRYADDFVLGFQSRSEAERFLRDLRARLQKFGLELHPDKTRLIEFGRFAAANRAKRGQGKPETFGFLGFTHYCSKRRSNGSFTVGRKTIATRLRATIHEVNKHLRRRRHDAVKAVGYWLRTVIRGWSQYHAVPGNINSLDRFRTAVGRCWHQALRRRSQTGRRTWTWDRTQRLIRRWFPPKRILHPYPSQRLRVKAAPQQPKVRAV
jgi:group II intron reverse transcriptase/maturase